MPLQTPNHGTAGDLEDCRMLHIAARQTDVAPRSPGCSTRPIRPPWPGEWRPLPV